MSDSKITAFENGPFHVLNLSDLVNSSGESLETEDEMYLCRCGGSATKPYCDRSHETNGFNSKNPDPDRDRQTKIYQGKAITIYDNRDICSHRGYCTGELPTVFRKEEPWIDPDGDTVEKIIAVCDKCPSGALSYSLNGQERAQGQKREGKIRLSERHFGYHGPYDVTGNVRLQGAKDRDPESATKMTLCRCGHSKNKPFCDGEHYEHQFEDEQNE